MNEDDGWGRETRLIPSNMLYVYRANDPRAKQYIATVAGAHHEDRLFIHDTCDGQRRTYSAEHVNQLLLSKDNPDGIKERIVELIPRLSPEQKQSLLKDVGSEALDVIRAIDFQAVELLQAPPPRAVSTASSERSK